MVSHTNKTTNGTEQLSKAEWKAQKKDQVEQLLNDVQSFYDEITAQIKAVTNKAGFDKIFETLRKVSQLSKYSPSNQIIIYSTLRSRGMHPTILNGFQQWKKVGRCVKKGEKGIAILAPTTYTKIELDENGQEQEVKKLYFKIVYVFDYQQTEVLSTFKGKPFELSDLRPKSEIEGSLIVGETNDADMMKTLLLSIAKDFGIKVFDAELKNDNLFGYAKADMTITMNTTANKTVNTYNHTLLHEMAHINAGHVFDKDRSNSTMKIQELEAELIASVCGFLLGIPSQDASKYYLSGKSDFTDKEFDKSAERIIKTAQKMLAKF